MVVLEVGGLILRGRGGGWTLFILLSIFNNLPEPSKSMKEMYTISKPSTYKIPNVSTHKTDSGWTVAYYSAILSSKKDCTQWTASTAGLRYRKQIRSVEAILCRTKLSGMIFSKVRTFRLQNKAFFQRCIFLSLVLTYGTFNSRGKWYDYKFIVVPGDCMPSFSSLAIFDRSALPLY